MMATTKHQTTTAFLDSNQYSLNSIKRYEFIFGRTFVSTGGLETTKDFCDSLNLQPGERVLDVGCGTGGSAIHMATKYQVDVTGVDLSTNMLAVADQYKKELPKSVQSRLHFNMCDVLKTEFPDASFDVIYSRDTLLHIPQKQELFKKFYAWLRPGGRVLISDYCRGENESSYSATFVEYIAQRGYDLLPVSTYGNLLRNASFNPVEPKDVTDVFVKVLQTELQRLRNQKAEFLQKFSNTDYSDLEEGWLAKLQRCKTGEQRWGLFKATKSS